MTMQPIPATLPRGIPETRKPQPGRTVQLWTITYDPNGLFRAGKAQFGSLDMTAMLREKVFADGTLVTGPDGQTWRVQGKTKVKVS